MLTNLLLELILKSRSRFGARVLVNLEITDARLVVLVVQIAATHIKLVLFADGILDVLLRRRVAAARSYVADFILFIPLQVLVVTRRCSLVLLLLKALLSAVSRPKLRLFVLLSLQAVVLSKPDLGLVLLLASFLVSFDDFSADLVSDKQFIVLPIQLVERYRSDSRALPALLV